MAELLKKQEGQPMKFSLTHYRKAGITHEAFMKWIVEVHIPKAIPIFKKHGIIGYALVSSSSQFFLRLEDNVADHGDI